MKRKLLMIKPSVTRLKWFLKTNFHKENEYSVEKRILYFHMVCQFSLTCHLYIEV